jgi:hypothetical protein
MRAGSVRRRSGFIDLDSGFERVRRGRVVKRPFNSARRPSSAASSTGLVTKALAPFSFARARSCGVS